MLGPERPPRGQAESWAPDSAPRSSPPGPRPRDGDRRGSAPPPRTPRRGQMWADVGAGRRRGGGAKGGRDSSPSLGRRVPPAGGFIYAAKQSSPSPPPPPPPSRAQRLQGLSARAARPGDPRLWARSRGARGERRTHMVPGGGAPPATPHPYPPTPGVACCTLRAR